MPFRMLCHGPSSLALLSITVALLIPAFASAHAEYASSIPPAGASVTAVPRAISVTFTEAVSAKESSLVVVGPGAVRVDLGDSNLDPADPTNRTLRVSTTGGKGAGVYRVDWTTVAAGDGEKASGFFTFTVAPPTTTPSRTSTAVLSPTTASSSPTAPPTGSTPGPTASATPTASRTATVTPTPPTVGGRSLSLWGNHATHLNWIDGTTETAYLVVRWAPPNEFAFLPSPFNLLGAGAAGYNDFGPFPHEAYCYIVVALGGTPPSFDQVLGLSDLLCLYPETHLDPPPVQFTIRLHESNTAHLRWAAAAGPAPTHYELTVFRFDGTPPQTIQLDGTLTSHTADTGGQATCYRLTPFIGPVPRGSSDIICGAPGAANFTRAPRGLGSALEHLQHAAPSVGRPHPLQ